MLRHLTIASFALIDNVELEFGKGLCVLVGETGAGKSIIIDALNAALGSRISPSIVRNGAKKAIVEATFDVGGFQNLKSFFEEENLDWDDNTLILRREITASGSSRQFVNDTPVAVTVAQEIATALFSFHGQHDTHGLLNPRTHLMLVDEAANTEHVLADLREAYQRVVEIQQQLDKLIGAQDSADEERSRLEFVINQIQEINPQPNEDDQILMDLKRAEAGEIIAQHSHAAHELLYAADESVYNNVQSVLEHLKTLETFHPELGDTRKELQNVLTTVKESAASIRPIASTEDYSAEHLENLRVRYQQLSRLVKKYGSLERSISVLSDSTAELATLDNLEELIVKLQAELDRIRTEALNIAQQLSKKRISAAKTFSSAVNASLSDLGLPNAHFSTTFNETELTARGIDSVQFLFSANKGEQPSPLQKVASGGELSRLMLSIKKSLAAESGVGTLVFDEIDTGISGAVARKVGDVIQDIAQHHQVICITHLAQIASLATQMVHVEKFDSTDRTEVTARTLNEEQTVTAIAQLLSGDTVSDIAMAGARELRRGTQKTLQKQ